MTSLQVEVFDTSGKSTPPNEKESSPEENAMEVDESTTRSSDQMQTEAPLISPNAASKQDVKSDSEEAHGSGQTEQKQAANNNKKSAAESGNFALKVWSQLDQLFQYGCPKIAANKSNPCITFHVNSSLLLY
jgi:hypothetical protein